MPRLLTVIHRRIGCGVLLLGVGFAANVPQAAEPSLPRQTVQWVTQLGHDEFAMREQAAARLIELGVASIPALEQGQRSLSREIQYRSQMILSLVAEVDFQRRLQEFERDTDPDQDYGLPGWPAFRDAAGHTPSARALFVAMQEVEPHLLSALGGDAKRLNSALTSRCETLRLGAQFGRSQVQLGTIAALLFVAVQDGSEITPLVRASVYMLCADSSFEAAIESGAMREVLVSLVERWLEREPLQSSSYALHLGLSHNIHSSAGRAREVLKLPAASPTDRLFACLCLAKFGEAADLGLLETLLEDLNVCAQTQVDAQIVVTEMRDVALASLVHLSGQSFEDYGFDRLQKNKKQVFDLPSLGFRDEQHRAIAIQNWRDYRRRVAE